jgi:hypothetical protein
MHIHISKGDEFAKIELENLRVVRTNLEPQGFETGA